MKFYFKGEHRWVVCNSKFCNWICQTGNAIPPMDCGRRREWQDKDGNIIEVPREELSGHYEFIIEA